MTMREDVDMRPATRLTNAWRVAVAIGLLMLVAGCSATSQALATVEPGSAADILASEDTVLLDIRTPEEYAAGIIEGAVNIDFYELDFADRLDALDKDAAYVVYCRSGNRSAQAMDLFERLGFADVTEIAGGIVNWTSNGLPVVAP